MEGTVDSVDEALRRQTERAIQAIREDLASMSSEAKIQEDLEAWRAARSTAMAALTAELEKELAVHEPSFVSEHDADFRLADQASSAPGDAGILDKSAGSVEALEDGRPTPAREDHQPATSSSRADVMAMLASSERRRASALKELEGFGLPQYAMEEGMGIS